MFNDNVSGGLNVTARINAPDHINGTIHLQLTGNGSNVFPYGQHIRDDDTPIPKFKLPVHFGKVGHPIRCDHEAFSPQRLFLGSIFSMD